MKELKISAIREGTVIDHVPADRAFKVIEILELEKNQAPVSVATNLASSMGKKGIIKVGGKSLTKEEVDKIALIAPKATVNIIKDYEVKKKEKVAMPNIFVNILKCANPNCVTCHEEVETKFYVTERSPLKVRCHYCERNMGRDNLKLL